MKYGTQTRAKYLLPYIKGRYTTPELSDKAKMRLKWMDYLHTGHSVHQASRHFDHPEPTIRYWKHRYNPRTLSTLEDRSRRPVHVRQCTVPWQIQEQVSILRKQYPRWGKAKLQQHLRKGGIHVGRERIQKVINRNGLQRIPRKKGSVTRRNRRHMYSVPPKALRVPGGLIYMDVKHVYLPNGTVYQFTALDHATRVVLVRLYSRITSRCGRDFLRRVQEVFRDIQYVGSDNGSEFLGEFGKELDRQKIPHVFSSPHSPKQNPYVERVIRTIIDEVYLVRGTEYNMQVQQQVLDKYVQEYNHQRPHWSLNLRTPMEQLQLLKSQPS